MSVSIIPKSKLSDEQLKYISDRISSPEHKNDKGPSKFWHYQSGLYAIMEIASSTPIGIVEQSAPLDAVAPGWWIDSRFRKKGFGSKMVDCLADYLKIQGATGVGNIRVQTHNGQYDAASEALKKRFKAHFECLKNYQLTTTPSSPLRGSDAANSAVPLVLDVRLNDEHRSLL